MATPAAKTGAIVESAPTDIKAVPAEQGEEQRTGHEGVKPRYLGHSGQVGGGHLLRDGDRHQGQAGEGASSGSHAGLIAS